MGDDEDKGKRPRGSTRRVLNYFGLFLLFLSLGFIFAPAVFAPLFLNYFSVADAVVAFYFWTIVNYFIFAFSIILLIVNNVFRFFENQRAGV